MWRRGSHRPGQEVTAIVADNFTKNAASVAVMMSEVAGADLFPVDIGMVSGCACCYQGGQYKVACGTQNLAQEPAMSREEA